MKKLLALGGQKELRELAQQVEDLCDYELTVASYKSLEFFIKGARTTITVHGVDISHFDFVWIHSSWAPRPIAHAVALFLTHKNIPHTPVEAEGSKLSDMLALSIKNVRIPKTYYSHTSQLARRLDSIVKFCRYPFIMKSSRGTLGSDMFYIQNEQEFMDALPFFSKKIQYICQSFIPNDFDYRVIIGQGLMLSAEKRTRKEGEYRNNAYLGATEDFMLSGDLPPLVHDIAQDSSQSLGLNWAGVDIVTSTKTGKNFVLELNRRPGLTQGSTEMSAALAHMVHLLDNSSAT